MAMNIAKLQSQLQRVPDESLIGYVQNPDGQVPSYLALAELTRRKQMRGSATQKPEPTQTVADQAVAEAQPMPGVAGLPVPDQMFNPESYASGGIVAFEDGGEVPGYAAGDLVQFDPMQSLTYTDYMKLSPQQKLAHQGRVLYMGNEDLQDPTGQGKVRTGFMAGMYDKLGVDKRINPTYDVPKTQKSSDFSLSKPESPLGSMFNGEDINTYMERMRRDPNLLRKYKEGQLRPYEEVAANIRTAQTPVPMSAAEQKMFEGRPAPTPLNYDRPAPQQIMSQVAQRDKAVAAPASTSAMPSAAPSKIGRVQYEAPVDYSGEYDQNIRPEISAQEAMAKFQGLMGTDVGREKVKERLAGMEAKAAKDEERAPWMALAEAGLGIAGGKSQFAIQNIAEGGAKGLKSYADARDRLNKAEERRFELSSKIAQAERADQVAAATYGLQSEEAVKTRNEANRLAKLGYKANLASDKAKGEFEAKKTNLEADIAEKKLQEEARWHDRQYDADMARTSVMGANAQFTKEQAQATNLLKQIMAPKIAALKAAGMAEEEAYDQVFPSALTQLPPNMLAALGYNTDTLPKPAATGPRKKPLSAF